MPLYFAYGSNLHVGQMRRRCPTSRPFGAAAMLDHHLSFPRVYSSWDGGVAGVDPIEGHLVEGALYTLDDSDFPALDDYECVDEQHYERVRRSFVTMTGESVEAWVYLAVPEDGGPFVPSVRYLNTMLAGAEYHRLSGDWTMQLRRLLAHHERPTMSDSQPWRLSRPIDAHAMP